MELEPSDVDVRVGRFLMAVRDEAIRSFEAAVLGQLRSARAIAIAELAAVAGDEKLVSVGRSAIDDVFVTLLSALDASDDIVLAAGTVSVAGVSDGLSGELFGERGWIAEFSAYESTA